MALLRGDPVWPRLHFAWVGAGTREAGLRSMASALGVAGRVRFLGEQPDITGTLDASDLFVLPSQFEGMPLAVMEAMARGLPVIATAVSGIPEELGDAGRLLSDPVADPEATVRELAGALREWAGDEGLRRAVGRACRARAEALFTEDSACWASTPPSSTGCAAGESRRDHDRKCRRFPHVVSGNPGSCRHSRTSLAGIQGRSVMPARRWRESRSLDTRLRGCDGQKARA